MTRLLLRQSPSLSLFVLLFACNLVAEDADFSGHWVLRLGQRPLMVATLSRSAGAAGPFSGSLSRPDHFSSTGTFFSRIKGPVVRYGITQSAVKGECLGFTAQNPADKNDKDDYLLCPAGAGQGTLGYDNPAIEPWPVTREKEPAVVASDWENRTYFLDDGAASNPEMQRILDADQKDRTSENADWNVVVKSDEARRTATRQLIADNKLRTGQDYEQAAIVFQHGDKPDDYLFAHTLAMIAVARGQAAAMWIGAATLDRYLQSMHQPQIYGTQFLTPQNQPVTQEPYNRTLISDAMRLSVAVPSQAAQEKQRKMFEAEASQR